MKSIFAILFFLQSFFIFAQDDPFVGEIKIFAGNFAPRGYAFCNGQTLSIAQNSALFSLIGNTYGGNGTSTFALPDLRERVVMSPGQGSILSLRDLGETGGNTTVSLLANQLPSHNHVADINISNATSTSSVPSSSVAMGSAADVFNGTSRAVLKFNSLNEDITLSGINTTNSNISTPLNIEQPYLVCNYIIALQGIFPARQ